MSNKLPGTYRITMDMMKRAKKSLKKQGLHPCTPEINKVFSALPAADYQMSKCYKYVKDMDDCVRHHRDLKLTKRKPPTLFYLSKYLDQKKHRKNTNWTKEKL
uniref:Uncharacterized protein n=1 Tax=Entomoneis paludosa TaxID=265537 RepID=A0A7S2VE49_9STRA|mmetsp:Transcript_18916/g.39175  ORF Transcript_18916/g.39175 Transcript_18916/m.39175 type:complete len:103 (+) Transcript_18916:92-400(+)|eukprot:CAMPEP_0172458868 /NCGR_PEP_ID=MMETSP1065-20121228/29734_1 /TAXON_ID=265537 /ORGANISM="Amphiprora paludosa, Strain CCMP125" /LENGTH=102 /DNA_ID=CAMNT_0013213311 /DNA_START=85 /DNA_END=393 /DNA_ORIENTATION=-